MTEPVRNLLFITIQYLIYNSLFSGEISLKTKLKKQ